MLPLYSIVEEDDDTALIVESQPDPNWVNKTGLADPCPLSTNNQPYRYSRSVPDLPILTETGLS